MSWSDLWFWLYLAVGAGRKQQQITKQLLMNHFIFAALSHQLPHLCTHKHSLQVLPKKQLVTENDKFHLMCTCSVRVKPTSCWSKTRSISRALMCCFFPWSCRRRGNLLKSPDNWHTETDNNQRPCAFLSPCFPWTSWREWSFSSVSQTPSCVCLGKTWGHWWSAVRRTEKWCRETFAGLPQDRIITFLRLIIEESQGLDTLMMTKSDFVSSSLCSKMWSEWEKSGYGLIVHYRVKRKSSEVKIFTHVVAVSWFGRWTLCSSPETHLERRRHTDILYGHGMQDEHPHHPLKRSVFVCVHFLVFSHHSRHQYGAWSPRDSPWRARWWEAKCKKEKREKPTW